MLPLLMRDAIRRPISLPFISTPVCRLERSRAPSPALKIEKKLIRLDNKVVPADRDFELTWTPAAGLRPTAGWFREHAGGSDYVLALVTPPAQVDRNADTGQRNRLCHQQFGSMAGTSISGRAFMRHRHCDQK
jgi:hypothetical protein